MKKVIDSLTEFFSKFPQLPNSWREIIVKILPYINIISIIFIVLGALAILSVLFGFGMLGAVAVPGGSSIALVTIVANFILSVMATPGLFKRQEYAWNLMFYSSVISAVTSVLQGSIISAGVTLLITWYILFQIHTLYTGQGAVVNVVPQEPQQPTL